MNQKQFEEQCFQAHNEYRKAHGAAPLQTDAVVSKEAQQWAEHLAKMGSLSHSNKKHLGENVAYTSGSATGFSITKMWYDEIENYSWKKHGSGNGKTVGHFTQVVWKESTHAGFGIATGPKGTFAVGNYKPAGNMMMQGYYARNVGEKGGEPELPKDAQLHGIGSKGPHPKSSFQHGQDNTGVKAHSMPKPGTTVETKEETYTEDGKRKKKTTTITTTVTETPEGGYKTSTKTATKYETLPGDFVDRPSALAAGVKNLNVGDSDSSDDDDDNKMSKSDKKKFRSDCLQEINEKRGKHGACKLTKSNRLQKIAQKHANTMLKKKDLSLYKGERLGQSLSMRQPRPKGKEVVDQWYSEKSEYNFSKAEFVRGAGNFTQMVWKASREIGVGVASNQDGETYIIALFDPPGNVTPQFRDNVQKD